MEKFLLILLFFHVSSSEKHFLKFFSFGSFGIPNVPDFAGTVEVDGIEAAYCDSNKKIKPKHYWVALIMTYNLDQVNWYKGQCFGVQPLAFENMINHLMKSFSQSKGVHVLQRISGCEWDDETGQVKGFIKYGYDGEDILSFDVKRLTWVALKPEAESLKLRWNADVDRMKHDERYLTTIFSEWLKKYVKVEKMSLLRKVSPSVFFLQKSPSSPITCFATGFFPDRAKMFWRKDGEELFKDVEYGEILPNQDGSFQMSVELNISSVTPEDWGKYECVFQFSGVEEEIIKQLYKDRIWTNKKNPISAAVIMGLFLLFWVLVTPVIVFLFHRQRKSESLSEDHGRNRVPVCLRVVRAVFIMVIVAAVVGFMFNRQSTEDQRTEPLVFILVSTLVIAVAAGFMYKMMCRDTKTRTETLNHETTLMNSPS